MVLSHKAKLRRRWEEGVVKSKTEYENFAEEEEKQQVKGIEVKISLISSVFNFCSTRVSRGRLNGL